VPLIDLDHQVRVTAGRAPRQHLRALIPLTAGLLLFGLAGDPDHSLSPHDKTTFCPLIALAAGAAGAKPAKESSTRVTVLDAGTGKVARIIYCPTG
jgi:hypothetical protein